MTCNIYAVAEYRESDYWYGFSTLHISKNYNLFALMADVHNYNETICVARAKGYPKNGMSFIFKHLYFKFVVEDSYEDNSVISKSKAQYWKKEYMIDVLDEGTAYEMISSPDWHDCSWLETVELIEVQQQLKLQLDMESKELDAIINMLLVFDPELKGNARICFFFDN